MLRGECHQTNGKIVRTFVHGVAFLLACTLFTLIGISPAHAVSTGCTAVRGGAASTSGIDVNFTGDFEAGETVVWTFSGGNADEVAITPPGGLQPVVNRVVTFTFPTTGSFDIDLTGNNAATATCHETTVEKQAAVRAAVKTLTEMQLIQSLAFQGQLMTELTNLFLSGAAPALTLERLELHLAVLQRRKTTLENEAEKLRNLINTATTAIEDIKLLPKLRGEPGRIDKLIGAENAEHERLLNEQYFPEYLRLLRRYKTTDDGKNYYWIPGGEAAYKKELRVLGIKYFGGQSQYSYQDEPDGIITKVIKRIDALKLERARVVSRISAAEANIRTHLEDIRAVTSDPISQIRAIRAGVPHNQSKLDATIAKLDPINSEIARVESEIAALRAQVGQPPPAPFASANLQGALGLRQEPASNPYTPNPFGLKKSRGGLSFFADLNTLRRQAKVKARLQQAPGSTPQVLTEQGSANILNPAFNVWAKGEFSDFKSDQTGADREGQAYNFATGAYYAFNPRFMFGTMYRYRASDSESTAQNSDTETRGHGVGLHSTLVLTPSLSASAQLLYERSENDFARGVSFITPVATNGSFDADQFVASGSLQGTFWRGPVWLRPSVGVTWAHVDSEAFIDSSGTRIPGQTTEMGQVTFGPSIGYRTFYKTGPIQFIEPSFSATGVWTFADEGDTTLASGTIIEQDDVAAQFSAGLSVLLRSNTQISLNGGYAGLGASEVETWSFGGQVSIPLGRQ